MTSPTWILLCIFQNENLCPDQFPPEATLSSDDLFHQIPGMLSTFYIILLNPIFAQLNFLFLFYFDNCQKLYCQLIRQLKKYLTLT